MVVQVGGKVPDFGVAFENAVDGVEHPAGDEHLTGAPMVQRYVPHVLDFQRVGIQFSHGRVVVGRNSVDHPQTRLVHGKVEVT